MVVITIMNSFINVSIQSKILSELHFEQKILKPKRTTDKLQKLIHIINGGRQTCSRVTNVN